MKLATHLLVLALGVGLAAAGVVTAVEAVLVLLGGRPWLVDAARIVEAAEALSWDDRSAMAASAAATFGGAGLILLAVWPRRTGTVPAAELGRGRTVVFERRGLERRLAAAARADRDVVAARVRLRGSWTRVRLKIAPGADAGAVTERVTASLKELGDELRLQDPLRPRIRVRPTRRRAV